MCFDKIHSYLVGMVVSLGPKILSRKLAYRTEYGADDEKILKKTNTACRSRELPFYFSAWGIVAPYPLVYPYSVPFCQNNDW